MVMWWLWACAHFPVPLVVIWHGDVVVGLFLPIRLSCVQFGKPTNEQMHSFVGCLASAPLATCGSSVALWLSGEVGWVMDSGRSGGSDGEGSGR